MKYSVRPVAPHSNVAPDIADENYLRKALVERLTGPGATDVVFDFQVQVRTRKELEGRIESEIEDACFEWDEQKHPFVTVAKIIIKKQNFDTEDAGTSAKHSPSRRGTESASINRSGASTD